MKKKIILLIIAIAAFSVFFISCGESDTKKEQGAVTEEPGEIVLPVDESTQALGEAFFRLFASDAEGQFVLRAGEISLSGNLQISLDGAILAYIDTEISGVPASLGFQAEDGQNCVFLDAFGAKLYFDLADLPEVAERLSALAEGREPSFTEGETGEKIYPPFEIAGFNVQTVFDLLSDFDATSLLPLMAEISGEKTEEGFSYDIPLAEGVSILLEVSSERDLKTFSLAAGESLSFELTEIRAPEEKLKAKLDPVADGYTDIKQYIYIAEKFCDEKIESVPELIAAVGRIDLGKAAALVSGIAERRAVSFSAEVNAGGVAATAAVSLDFSEELRAAVSAEISGVEAQLTLFGGELYARAGALALKGDAADAKKILSMFGVEFNAQGLSFENLTELFSGLIAGDVLDKISVENGEIRISAFGLEIVFSPEDLTLSVSGGSFTARIFDLAVGTGVSAPEGEYTEAKYLLPLAEKALALVNGGAVSVGGTVSVGQTEIALDARLRLQPLAVSGAAEIGGTKIGFSYDGEKLFLSAGEVSVSMDRLAAKKILDGLTSGLPAFEMPSPDILLGMIASVAADETGAEIVVDLSYFGAGTLALRAAAEEEGISLSVSAESLGAELTIGAFSGGIEMPEKASDVSGFVRAVDIPALLRLAEGILTEKTANASFSLQAEGLQAEGTAAVGFADGLRAEISVSIGENEIRAYYAEGVLYLEKQGVRLSADAEDIGALLALFGIKADGLKTTFSAIGIGCEGEDLIIEIGGAKIAVNGKTLQAEFAFAGVKAAVSGIAAGGDVSAPEGEYTEAEYLLPLAEKALALVNGGVVSVGGTFSVGQTEIALDARLRLQPLAVSGAAEIGGTKIGFSYDGEKLFLSAGEVSVSMDRLAAKKILDGLTSGLPAFEMPSPDILLGMIASVAADETGAEIVVDLSYFGAGTLALRAAAEEEGISLSVSAESLGAELTIGAFSGGIEMPEKASDVSGFVRAVDIPALLRLAEGILTEKTANASFSLQAEGLQAEGTAAVGFADGLRAEISVSIGENEIRAYYAEGVLYLEKQGVRLSADAEDIGALLALFGIKADGLKTTFSAIGIGCEGEDLIIEIGGAKIAVNGKTLQAEFAFAGVKAAVSGIAAGGDVSAPEGEFVALQDILPLIETISQMIGEMRFSVSGSLAFGGENATKLEIPSATVYSAGNGDIADDFREGRISIGGELVIGESHRLNVAFDGTDMYLCYNDAMKVRFSRASLDGLVQTLKENFAFILDGFVKAESLTQLFDSADYAALIGMIASLSAERDENGAVTLAVTLALPSSAISVSIGEREGGAAISVSAEGLDCGLFLQPLAEDAAPVAAPENAEEYIDLSDIGYLADGFFKTAKSGEFVMSGTVSVKLDVLGINAVLDIGLQAQVRINFGEDGKISGVDAHVVFDNTAVARKGTNDLENTTVSAIHDLAVKYGRCEITFTNDTLYIDRMNMSKSIKTLTNTTDKFPFFEIRTGYQFEETAYEHKSVAAADAQGETLQDLIFYALGVNSMLADLFPSGGEADYARLLEGYVSADKDGQGVPHEHDVTLSLAALVGSDMFQPVAVKIFTGADNRIEGVSVKDLTIDFGAGTLKVDLEAENDLSAELDGSCFENYLQFEYQPFVAA